MGRPSSYNRDNNILVQGWARDGLTDDQIAKNLGICLTTLYEWKNKYAEFAQAIKKSKEVADREVESSLFKRANGYTYEEIIYNGDGEIVKRITKEVQPDVTAQIFWLKNRKPAEWRDKQDIEHSGKLDFGIKLPQGVDDE